jgi:membrane-bound lytic murein transglycosylase F
MCHLCLPFLVAGHKHIHMEDTNIYSRPRPLGQLISGALLFLLLACRPASPDSQQADLLGFSFDEDVAVEGPVFQDLPKIRERGRMVAIVDNSSTSYFIYKGQPMGYEYELLSRLAKHLKVDLEIVITTSLDEAFDKLQRGEGDIIAHNLTVTKARQEEIAFTMHHKEVRQVLVQRKPKGYRNLKRHELEDELIRNPLDLAGKEIWVKKNSAHYSRLVNLSEEIGADITIREEDDNLDVEATIKRVANGEIDYAIADENVAKINAAYFTNLDVATPVSFPQRIAWGVRKNAPELLAAVNDWIRGIRRTPDYNVIYNKYFQNRSGMIALSKSNYATINGNQLSPYDKEIKKAAETIGWDWRTLAAMVYQESKFNPEAESWMGAVGLLQLVPETAEIFGAEDPLNPSQNLAAGAAYIKWLNKFWEDDVANPEERQKFIMASFNVGQGHVLDACRLATKYGKDSQSWDQVSEFLLKKSQPKFYNDEVSKHGYCRGSEPVHYVKQIMQRAARYQQLIDGPVNQPALLAAAK